MDVDLEVGGNDQLFNMLAGRVLMKAIKGKEKYVLTTKLLVDREGKKAGKTTGNALFLDSTPKDFFGGIMSFPDELIKLGFELLTEVNLEGIEEKINKNPMVEKKMLANQVVKILWGEKESEKAQKEFEKTFQEMEIPIDLPVVIIKESGLPLLDLVFATKKVSSRSEAKRLITQKAVEIDGKVETDPTKEIEIKKIGLTIRIGKKMFVRLKKP